MTRPKRYEIGISGDMVEWIERRAKEHGIESKDWIQVVLHDRYMEEYVEERSGRQGQA